MKKATIALVGVASFAAGVALGFLISPVKHGIANNNGNKSYHYYGDNWTHDIDDDECSDCDCETEIDCDCDSEWEDVLDETVGSAVEDLAEEIEEEIED